MMKMWTFMCFAFARIVNSITIEKCIYFVFLYLAYPMQLSNKNNKKWSWVIGLSMNLWFIKWQISIVVADVTISNIFNYFMDKKWSLQCWSCVIDSNYKVLSFFVFQLWRKTWCQTWHKMTQCHAMPGIVFFRQPMIIFSHYFVRMMHWNGKPKQRKFFHFWLNFMSLQLASEHFFYFRLKFKSLQVRNIK